MKKFLRIARDLALSHNYDETLDFHLCSLIVRGGRVLSIGFNDRRMNVFTERAKQGFRDKCCSIHAECDGLCKNKKIDFTGAKAIIVRVKRDGTFGTARPCNMCENELRKAGIKKMIYSIDNAEFGIEKLTRI